MTYLEYRDEQSEKFWQINIEGCSHTVTFGRIGTKGQSKTKTFASKEECEKDAAKLIQSKNSNPPCKISFRPNKTASCCASIPTT